MTERQRALQVIREHFASFGDALDDLSDDELEAALVESSRLIADIGITAKQTIEALQVFCAKLSKENK